MHRSRWAIAGLSLCLCACATNGPRHPDATTESAREDKLNGDLDQGKVATVNRWALDHGATVIWTHYPQKRKGADGG
jgi:hypothetical protein